MIRTRMRKTLLLTTGLALLLVVSSSPLPLLAQEGEANSITITQSGPFEDVIGNWVLVRPENNQLAQDFKKLYIASDAYSGTYSVLIEPPDAASTTVKLYRNDLLEFTEERPKITFNMNENDIVHVEILYSYERTGLVSITSDPPNLRFRLDGPNSFMLRKRTPYSIPDAPEGLYSATFDEIDDCVAPKPQSDRLVKDGRINFHITFSCEGMDSHPEYQKQFNHVSLMIDGQNVVFHDVPIDSWFAPHVHTAAKTGILSGYRNRRGELTGEFGPGNNVTLAELAKIAHEVAGIDENELRGRARNERAANQWFEQYYISAEIRKWLVYRDARQDPGRPATRAEVVATVLQALDIPRIWPKGELFQDVDPDTPYASSIETGATDAIVSGSLDPATKSTLFRPGDPINRAELAKMLSLAIETYISDSPEMQPHALDK